METKGKTGNSKWPQDDMPLSIIVFEDDIYHYRILRHALQDINPNHKITGPLTSVESGKAFFSYHKDIDLIIADISIEGGLVFDALEYAPDDIPIIFTTSHKEYAFDAFKYNSLCYIVKPVDEPTLARAIKKTMPLIKAANHDKTNANDTKTYGSQHRHDFLVKTPTGDTHVYAPMLRYVASENKSTYLHMIDGTSYTLDITLENLASQLNPDTFMKVNRKYIVPKEQVKGLEHLANGRIMLKLYGNDFPEIIVSRTNRNKVCKWLNR